MRGNLYTVGIGVLLCLYLTGPAYAQASKKETLDFIQSLVEKDKAAAAKGTAPVEWSPQLVHRFGDYAAEVAAVAIAPDSQRIASADKDGLVRFLEIKTRASRELGRHSEEAKSLAFAPDGLQLASCSSSTKTIYGPGGNLVGVRAAAELRLWDLKRLVLERKIDIPDDTVVSLQFSSDGLLLACGCGSRNLQFFDAKSGDLKETVKTSHSNPVHTYSLLRDWKSVASASTRVGGIHEVKVWELPKGLLTQTITWQTDARGGWVRAFADGLYYSDRTTICCWGDDKALKVFDVESGQMRNTLTGHEANIVAGAFSDNGQWIATASDDGSARIWSRKSYATVLTLTGHRGTINCIAISGDGRTVVTGGKDKIVAVWDNAKATGEQAPGTRQ